MPNENNSSAPLKTAEGDYPDLPESVADVVSWGDDKPLDFDWGDGARLAGGTGLYTAEQMRAYASQAVAAQAPAAVAVPDEREAFALEIRKHSPHARLECHDGQYASPWVQAAWTGFSLRAALAATPADKAEEQTEPVGYMPVAKRLLHGHEPWEIPAQTIQRDAVRYRWLRTQFWNEAIMCVVMNSKSCVALGAICPSCEQLDSAIDAAMAAKEL